jgi:hypothetical protein
MPITLLAVILRFVSRSNRQQKFQIALEDWFAVVALLFFFGFCGAGLWSTNYTSFLEPKASADSFSQLASMVAVIAHTIYHILSWSSISK